MRLLGTLQIIQIQQLSSVGQITERFFRTRMAAVDIGARNGPPVPADDLDDLFDYDIGDVFRDVDTNMDAPAREKPAVNVDGKENGVRLGIDEEIKVVKKRAPIPKLDENRSVPWDALPTR